NTTRQVPVTWLTLRSKRSQVLGKTHNCSHVYRISYRDVVDPAAILMEVSLDRVSHMMYSLPSNQKAEIQRLVRLAQAVEQGDMSVNNIGDDVEEVVQIDEPPPKKPRLQKSASHKLRAKAKKSGLKLKRAKETKKQKQERHGESKLKKLNKKEAALELHPRADIIVLEKDPLFETECKLPYVSKVANSRLIFRAIHMENNKKLTKLLKDGSFIYQLYYKSVDNSETPYEAAVKVKNIAILETILHEFLGTKFAERRENNGLDPCKIDRLDTGRYNKKSLGIRYIRKITASRGSREGNNAFTESDMVVRRFPRLVIKLLLMSGVNEDQFAVIEKFFKGKKLGDFLKIQDVCDLLLVGQHQVAGRIVKEDLKNGRSAFNFLFKDVLLLTTEDLTNCPPSACKQINKRVDRLSPYHCAAANPNSKYLAKLLSVQPDVHISDAKGRRPIHYAAGCSSPDTLNLLLEWGANISDTDSTRHIPLHYAIEANRSHNVKILLEHNKKGGVPDLFAEQFGVGGVNRRTTNSMTPLHYAAKHGFVEIADLLVKFGAEVNAKLSVSEKQSTPLMLAAASGHLSMARLLVENGAVVEQQDRMGCTALVYACKNGATSVLTYFLRLGAQADRADNSGNTPIHYAAAYGWLLTLRTLLDAGVDPNVHNMWRTTPVSVAYLKSHFGIVQELLTCGKVDIDFTDEDGMSLLFHACGSDLVEKDLCEEITYMVKEKGARCDIFDNFGRSPLHHLTKASMSIDLDQDESKRDEDRRQALLQSVEIARLLIKHGCPLNAADQDGKTAVMTAVGLGYNFPLVEYLLSVGGEITVPQVVQGQRAPSTMMHDLASNIWAAAGFLASLTSLLKDKKHKHQVQKMCAVADTDGFTPLLRACFFARNGRQRPRPVTVFNVNASFSQSKINPWIPVREFIRALVSVFHADPNAEVKKKYFDLDDMPNPNSNNWWFRTNLAEKTAAHIVLFENDPDLTDEGSELPRLNQINAGYMFRDLVNLGADVNTRDFQGMTLLGSCIDEAQDDLLEFMKTNSDCDFNMPIKIRKGDKEEEIHPLLYASRIVSKCGAGMITGLIDCGSNINATLSDSAMKCLHILVAEVNSQVLEDVLKVVDKLAEKGCNFNCKDNDGKTALHYAVRAHTGDMAASMELEVKLLQLGSDPSIQDAMGRTALHYIYKPKSNQSSNRYRFGYSSKGDPAEMTQLISKNMRKDHINLQDRNGKTALHFAAEQGAGVCCMYLTMVGADPNVEDNDGNTPLALAVQNKFDGCASNLIQGGASLKSKVIMFSVKEMQRRKALEDKQDKNVEGEDSHPEYWKLQPARLIIEEKAIREIQLYEAAVENNLNGVAMFITGADEHISGLAFLDAVQITFRTGMYQTGLRLLHTSADFTLVKQSLESGRTLLHCLALSCEKSKDRKDPTLLKLAQWMVNAGLKPEALDDFGCSPVQYAILNRHFDLADFLAEKSGGYDVNYRDSMGRSHLAALMWRAHSMEKQEKNTWNFMKTFMGKGIDCEELFDLPINSELVALKINDGIKQDPDYFSKYPKNKTTALIVSIKSYDFSFAKYLLKSGVNPNTPDGEGISPLMHAIQLNQVNFVKLLLDFDFDPDKKVLVEETKAKKWRNRTSAFRLKAGMDIGLNDEDEDDDEKDEDDNSEDSIEEDEEHQHEYQNEFLPLKQTSSLNLDQKDKEGRTALHYVASSHPEGTFDNGEMAFLLIQNGCGLHLSKTGLTAYQEALKSGAATVAALLKVMFKLPEGTKTLSDKPRPEPVNDGLPPSNTTWLDVDMAVKKVLNCHTREQDRPTYVHTVDPLCHVKNGELVKDEEIGRFYDVLMTKVDVKRGEWGLYNFYQIQLVYEPNKDLYILFTRWGRISEDGQYQHTPFTNKELAVKEFAKVFREKSGNKWENIDKYEQKPRKYRLVEDAARQVPPPLKDIDIDLSSDVECVLLKRAPEVARVVEILMDPKSMRRSMENTNNLDTKCLPFGLLNKERLLEGQRLLQEIEDHVNNVEKYRGVNEKTNEDRDEYQKTLEKIADLSNEYFHVIPQSNFSCEKLRPLDQRSSLTKQMYNVSNLLHYQFACKILLATMWYKTYNPVDFVYHSILCKMQQMDQNDLMAQMILKYIYSYERTACNVRTIFRLERAGEEERRQTSSIQGERRLLWHGSDTCNLLSILNRGLVVSPPGASSSGAMYGKGIYFSDDFSFSANYVKSGKTKFMLLCEVAMGEVIDLVKEEEEKKDDEIPTTQSNTSFRRNQKTFDTIMVKGKNYYEPSDWFILSTGERLPLGKTKHVYSSYRSDRTQYVVRDPAAVSLRYLVEFS
ncbi:hypothetical protein EGW08_017016, partial [Elysia chlorotica]